MASMTIRFKDEKQKDACIQAAKDGRFIGYHGNPSVSAMLKQVADKKAVVVKVEILDALLVDIREFGVDIPQYAEEAIEALEKIID